jgi:hypothetical protein
MLVKHADSSRLIESSAFDSILAAAHCALKPKPGAPIAALPLAVLAAEPGRLCHLDVFLVPLEQPARSRW